MRKDFKNDTWELFNESAVNKKIYLFGAGDMGRRVAKECKKYNSCWEIAGFIDNDPQKNGLEIEGFRVYGKDILTLAEIKKSIILICTMYPGVIAQQLSNAGLSNYYSALWMDTEMKDYLYQQDIDDAIIDKLKNILDDEASRKLVDVLVDKRRNGFMDYTDIMSSGTEYFVDEYFSKDKDEVFVDGGAWDGDTIEEFCKWTGNQFKAIYSFEPDSIMIEKIKNKLYKFDNRIHVIPKGLYSKKTRLPFNNTDSVYSGRITEKNIGNHYIDVVDLDTEIQEKVSFIKMDIEGAEIPALQGAKNMIMRNKPKLAICIYHKPNDLWEIPLMLKEWVPEYKMHIRHYGMRYYSTILYAYI
ncbi:MAG: FkbM family methyltransferase [Clostridiales bacterium]|nr:FkbM family methyltransferase [Clostridiales bacterium]